MACFMILAFQMRRILALSFSLFFFLFAVFSDLEHWRQMLHGILYNVYFSLMLLLYCCCLDCYCCRSLLLVFFLERWVGRSKDGGGGGGRGRYSR